MGCPNYSDYFGCYGRHNTSDLKLELYYAALHLAICIKLMNEYVDLWDE